TARTPTPQLPAAASAQRPPTSASAPDTGPPTSIPRPQPPGLPRYAPWPAADTPPAAPRTPPQCRPHPGAPHALPSDTPGAAAPGPSPHPRRAPRGPSPPSSSPSSSLTPLTRNIHRSSALNQARRRRHFRVQARFQLVDRLAHTLDRGPRLPTQHLALTGRRLDLDATRCDLAKRGRPVPDVADRARPFAHRPDPVRRHDHLMLSTPGALIAPSAVVQALHADLDADPRPRQVGQLFRVRRVHQQHSATAQRQQVRPLVPVRPQRVERLRHRHHTHTQRAGPLHELRNPHPVADRAELIQDE